MNPECDARLKHLDRSQLHAKLRAVAQRLGTPAERPTDLGCAQTIAHRLANRLTADRLMDDVRRRN